MPDKPYHTLSTRKVWHNRWYSLREDEIRLPDGSFGTYTVVERPGAVWIVPELRDGQILLIRNYRYTVDQWLWEVPAGSVESRQSLEENARRELAEEVGGTAESLEYVASMYTAPGISDEQGHIFLARGVRPGKPSHEPTEVMEQHSFPPQVVISMAREGDITDGPSALALLLCASRLGGNGLHPLNEK